MQLQGKPYNIVQILGMATKFSLNTLFCSGNRYARIISFSLNVRKFLKLNSYILENAHIYVYINVWRSKIFWKIFSKWRIILRKSFKLTTKLNVISLSLSFDPIQSHENFSLNLKTFQPTLEEKKTEEIKTNHFETRLLSLLYPLALTLANDFQRRNIPAIPNETWSAIFLRARLAAIVRVSQIDKLGQETTCENGRWSPPPSERKCWDTESRFAVGNTCGSEGGLWKSLAELVFPAGRRFSTATPLLLAIPRVFLPDDDLFLTYTSLGTRPRGHSTSLELEITSSWKPIFRGPTEMSWGGKGWRGEHVAGKNEKYRLSPPPPSLFPCGDSYGLRYLYGILLSCRQTTGRKILG